MIGNKFSEKLGRLFGARPEDGMHVKRSENEIDLRMHSHDIAEFFGLMNTNGLSAAAKQYLVFGFEWQWKNGLRIPGVTKPTSGYQFIVRGPKAVAYFDLIIQIECLKRELRESATRLSSKGS